MQKNIIILFIIIFFNNLLSLDIIPGNDICEKEKKYILNRQDLVNAAIKQIIKNKNIDNSKLPKIAICFSGGGYRAMIASAGFIQAAEENNLLPAASCASALSGSAWLFIPLLTANLEMSQYKNILKNEVNTNFFNFKNIDTKKFIKNIYNYFENKDNYLMEYWSKTLSEHLLSGFNQNTTFKAIRKNLKTTNHFPFPLFSCLITNSKTQQNLPYNYMEISPFYTYSAALSCSVNTKFLGSTFQDGEILEKYNDLTESFFMGMLGSPFCISGGDVLSFFLADLGEFLKVNNYHYLDLFEKIFEDLDLYKNRVTPAQIPNYTYNYKKSSLSNLETLELADAGINILNLALDPLFRRDIDVLIICDSSADATTKNYPELELAANFAKDNNINFPDITNSETLYKNLDNFKIFYDQDNKKAPVIIYITNPIEESTLKLQYNPKEFDELYNTMHDIVINNTENIAKAIKLKIS
ncbi:MAG: hypothetical protein SZ59_C0002G0296 [candidate division TM6 bacterium GW2011_GWF2_28_16]|nr:MAG: hypothetical protein SZ59_C0002G0296 [candidate division TM6 bacterium GW2011_GWF2_28_16]